MASEHANADADADATAGTKRRRRATYADFVRSHDLNYGVSAPGQGGVEYSVQVTEPLEHLVFDEIYVEMRRRSAEFGALYNRARQECATLNDGRTTDFLCSEREASGPRKIGDSERHVNGILHRLASLECATLKPYANESAEMKTTRSALNNALHAAEEAARAYARAIADTIVRDAAPQIRALATSNDTSLRRDEPPENYYTPLERCGAIVHVKF